MKDKDFLIKAAIAYYNGHDLIMSDEDYDKLLGQIINEEPDFNIFNNIDIGEDRTNARHLMPYTPQAFKEPFYDMDELVKKINDTSDSIPVYKLDGTSITAYYCNGVLIDIITRSDETFGKRKYDQLIKKVPIKVNPCVQKIDYEACCSKEDFIDDCRSNSNGLINSCYKQDEVDKYIQLIPFKVTCDPSVTKEYIPSFLLAGYTREDIPIVPYNLELKFEDRYILYKGKHYPIDGFVIYTDTITPHKIYKHYANQLIVTTVTDIEWRYTDKWCWVPKIIYDTIRIDGRNCSQSTSGGLDNLRRMKCGIGSKITIKLANSTIPIVDSVIEESENYKLMEECPYCGSKMEEVNSKLRCSNLFCKETYGSITELFIMNAIPNYKELGLTYASNKSELIDIKNKLTLPLDKNLIPINIMNSIVIERFSAIGLIVEQLSPHIDEIINKKSISEFIKYGFTDKQAIIFDRYVPILDELINIMYGEV